MDEDEKQLARFTSEWISWNYGHSLAHHRPFSSCYSRMKSQLDNNNKKLACDLRFLTSFDNNRN